MTCLLDLAFITESDPGLVKTRKFAERGLAKYKRADIREFYSEQLAAIDAFNAAQAKGN